MKKDVEIPRGDATRRIAVMNCDWEHLKVGHSSFMMLKLKAVDILVLLQSFLPPEGFIKSVTVYPSDFGLQKMKEVCHLRFFTLKEQEKGPDVAWVKKEDGTEEIDKHKLREYELNRLK